MMACAPPGNAIEQAYNAALGKVAKWSVENDQLVLRSADGKDLLTYRTATVIGAWDATSVHRGDSIQSVIIGTKSRRCSPRTASSPASPGCNTYSAAFTLNQGSIKIEQPISTRMACSEPDGVGRAGARLPRGAPDGRELQDRGFPDDAADGGRDDRRHLRSRALSMSVIAALAADERAVVVAIVLARLLVPLLIPRFPLVIIAALVLDGDRQLAARRTSPTVDLGPDGPYQSFDKALDIYYLAIAVPDDDAQLDEPRRVPDRPVPLLLPAGRRARVRAARRARDAVDLPEHVRVLSSSSTRWCRLRFDPARCSARFWLLTAAGLWVFVKLPQEYWIRIAQRDFTDTVADHPWFGVVCALFVLGAASPCCGSSCARACPRPIGRGGSRPIRCPRRSPTRTRATPTGCARRRAVGRGGREGGAARRCCR